MIEIGSLLSAEARVFFSCGHLPAFRHERVVEAIGSDWVVARKPSDTDVNFQAEIAWCTPEELEPYVIKEEEA